MTARKPPLGPHRSALEETVVGSPALTEKRHAAIVQLARTLADQIDAAGPEVSTRLSAAYLSSLKDLRRAVEGSAGAGRSTLTTAPGTVTGRRSWRSA